MNPNLDLRQLAVRREEPPAREPGRRRRLVTRYLLPAGVLLCFASLFAWAARDSLLPSRPVTVVPVIATRAEVRQAGTPLFQAAGWIEPRPTPVVVTALAEGVVEELLVVQNQEVKAGQVMARLIDRDARLAVDAARAELAVREAERDSARAARDAARTAHDQPVHLEAALADAAAQLARVQTEATNLPFQRSAAEAREALAEADWQSKKAAPGAVPSLAIQRAKSELDVAAASVRELRARESSLKREVEALTARRDALQKQLKLKTAEVRQLAEAEAQLKAAEARVQQAQVAVETVQLRLERMTVRAPTDGRVLDLVAWPGARLMGTAPGSRHDASTVVTLYNPHLLQVRADVRLEDVPRVQPGQPVLIETPAAPGGRLEGEVLFATSQADIQKNTLSVKVAVRSPPPTVRSDMLVQVTFLAPSRSSAWSVHQTLLSCWPRPGLPVNAVAAGLLPVADGGPEMEPLRLLVPRQLVETGADGVRVWVADQAAGMARPRMVKLGLAAGDLVEVTEGLSPADKLIASGRDGLRDGQRIRVTGEDPSLGIESRGSGPAPRLSRRTPTDDAGHKHGH